MSPDGIMAPFYDLSDSEWSEGRANGTVPMPAEQPDVPLKAGFRNALTFSPLLPDQLVVL